MSRVSVQTGLEDLPVRDSNLKCPGRFGGNTLEQLHTNMELIKKRETPEMR